MHIWWILLVPMLLISCGKSEDTAQKKTDAPAIPDAVSSQDLKAETGDLPVWELNSGSEGVSLALRVKGQQASLRLFCPSGENRLNVNVQSFRAISSEERLTIGSGRYVTTLVAESRGDSDLGGVSGTGAVPVTIDRLFKGPLSINYGAQDSGPHSAPPDDISKAFSTACTKGLAETVTARQPILSASACSEQDGQILQIAPRRATGTEPFWGARIAGRCVHYSHMEDQKGTRIWTRYTSTGGAEIWSGALEGKLFELILRAHKGCSDGMSDTSYPFAVELKVSGEVRKGCAGPV